MPSGDEISLKKAGNPFFSIIMPTYNRADFLSSSLTSVFAQNFTDWELIIVDDGSEDHTKEVVESYHDSRIKYYYKPNGGVSSARNLAIEKSNGLYVCFLDDDDEYLPHHLSYFYSVITERSCPITLLATHILKRSSGKMVELPYEDYAGNRVFGCLPWTPAVCIHREILKKHRFNENLYIREDHELFDRIRSEYGIIGLENRTVIVNRHKKNVSSDNNRYYLGLEDAINFYIKDRKKIHWDELKDLSYIYYKLFYRYFNDHQYLKSGSYFLKMLLIMPAALFNKETRAPYRKVKTKILNKIFSKK